MRVCLLARTVVAVSATWLVVIGGPAATASAARRPHVAHYHAPVDAAVRDPFRPPACLWCPGNRGLEYATSPGQPVRAAGDGVVAFAGQVGGLLYVVIDHADGLRTTYGLLSAILVVVGARLRQGDLLGHAGPAVFFGVRRGDVYLDPAPLLAGAVLVPRLVPTTGGAARWR